MERSARFFTDRQANYLFILAVSRIFHCLCFCPVVFLRVIWLSFTRSAWNNCLTFEYDWLLAQFKILPIVRDLGYPWRHNRGFTRLSCVANICTVESSEYKKYDLSRAFTAELDKLSQRALRLTDVIWRSSIVGRSFVPALSFWDRAVAHCVYQN